MAIRSAVIQTVLGELTATADGDWLSGLYFPGHWYLPGPQAFGRRVLVGSDSLLQSVNSQLSAYLSGETTRFDVPVLTRGGQFQEQVWAILKEIPYGETTTYGAIAQQLGNRALAQSVGQAVGHNPISIIIPCHRVIGANGKLTGFAGGIERKKFLLDLEEPQSVCAGRLF